MEKERSTSPLSNSDDAAKQALMARFGYEDPVGTQLETVRTTDLSAIATLQGKWKPQSLSSVVVDEDADEEAV